MTDAPAPIRRMVDATDAADSDAFVDCFTDDAYLEDWGRGFHGHDGVRSWNRTDNIGKRSHFVIDAARQDGAAWVVTVTVSGDGFTGTSDIRFTLDGDRISRLIIAP